MTPLQTAAELLQEVMAEGVEHQNRKYALVQMSHALRTAIYEFLTEQELLTAKNLRDVVVKHDEV
jgi:uncharacterized protein YllA (UPF0747 family)